MKKQYFYLVFLFISILFICFLVIRFFIKKDFSVFDREIVQAISYNAIELKGKTIIFNVRSMRKGIHYLSIRYGPYDIDLLRKEIDPIKFEYTVEIEREGKVIEKKKKLLLTGATLGTNEKLYSVPEDFFWNFRKNLRITIKDISFDEKFSQNYKIIRFTIEQRNYD